MKQLSGVLISAAILLSACNGGQPSEKKESQTKTEATADNKDKALKPLSEKEATKIFGAVESQKPGVTKKYPVKGITTKTISEIIKVKDNKTIIYTEDTGHGIPTVPAGEGHEFYAISEVKYKDMAMYMLQDGRFVTADPKHVEVVSQNDDEHYYPIYKMHEDDEKYLASLDKNDPDFKAYEQYTKDFGQKQFDSKRELLMHTAIHQVNNQNEGTFVIKNEPFKPFDAFKKSK